MAATVKDVVQCSLPSWYPQLQQCALKAAFYPLSQPFVEYLNADGIIMSNKDTGNNIPSDEDDVEGDENENDKEPIQHAEFSELEDWIERTIDEFGGSALPKLNWSAPKDAIWITTAGSMQCRSAQEIFLLLKSSDHISFDLANPFSACIDASSAPPEIPYFLVLKQWYNIPSSMEFRCFVKSQILIGISQRDNTNFYQFLVEKRKAILTSIVTFFYKNLFQKFSLENYVFDVVLTTSFQTAKLVDINPFGTVTEPLLFEWEELAAQEAPATKETIQQLLQSNSESSLEQLVDLRLIESQHGIRPSSTFSSRIPKDIYDFASSENAADFLKQMREMQLKQSAEESSEGDND